MGDRAFWETVYRALGMIQEAIKQRYLREAAPTGRR
jgi:hypothetical protein